MMSDQQETVDFAREVERGLPADDLPAYAPMLAAYHRAHAPELQTIISMLPLQPGDHVLDMACGDGTYTCWLAERVGLNGSITGIDISAAYLNLARQHIATSPYQSAIRLHIGNIEALPFLDNTFDLAWCAHSLYSLPDPIEALRELRRVVRPGGRVAILEQDTLHRVIIPWPMDLELAVRQAQIQALSASSEDTDKFCIGRWLSTAFTNAGLASYMIRPHTTIRHAPLNTDDQLYLSWYFRDLSVRAKPYLEPTTYQVFDHLFNLQSPQCVFYSDNFYVIYIDMLAWGIKTI